MVETLSFLYPPPPTLIKKKLIVVEMNIISETVQKIGIFYQEHARIRLIVLYMYLIMAEVLMLEFLPCSPNIFFSHCAGNRTSLPEVVPKDIQLYCTTMSATVGHSDADVSITWLRNTDTASNKAVVGNYRTNISCYQNR